MRSLNQVALYPNRGVKLDDLKVEFYALGAGGNVYGRRSLNIIAWFLAGRNLAEDDSFMATVLNADTVLLDLDDCLAVWKDHPEIKLGKSAEKQIALADAQALRGSLDTCNKAVTDAERELTGLRNSRDDTAKSSNDVVTRFRSAVKGLMGPDSTEYEKVGGTRSSEIKRSPRKPKTDAAK